MIGGKDDREADKPLGHGLPHWVEAPLADLRKRWGGAWSSDLKGWGKVSRDLARWALIAVPIGVVAGVGAVMFYSLWLLSTYFFLDIIVGIQYPLAGGLQVTWSSSFPRILLLPLVMGLGGVVSGAIAQWFAPEIAGHGTDQAIRAFHQKEGRIRYRVPLLKVLASSITLGTGGAGGREGPVSQVGGGFGSLWADALGLSPSERRIALASGLGAGVGAIFRAPLGGAIYAAEIFYTGDFEPVVFVPAIISSVVSYSIYGSLFGFQSIFASPGGTLWTVPQIPLYALLGLVCAGVGVGFVQMYRRTESWFSRSGLPLSLRAGLGAVSAGVLVLVVYFTLPAEDHYAALAAINVGYGFVQAAMLGQVGSLGVFGPLALLTIGVAVVLRMLTTSLTVGSGGSAGLFGTSVVVGALLGTVIGGLFHLLSPSLVPSQDVAAFVIVGMMAFFGGISKAPLAVLVMVVEMAGSYSLLLPAMLAIFIAYLMTGSNHLYSEQVSTRLRSPAHRDEYRRLLLSEVPVLALTRPEMTHLPPGASIREALQIAANTEQYLFPVKLGQVWQGIVKVSDLLHVPEDERAERRVGELVRPFEVLVPEYASAAEALAMLEQRGVEVAAVLGHEPFVHIVGMVTRVGLSQLRSSAAGVRSGSGDLGTGGG